FSGSCRGVPMRSLLSRLFARPPRRPCRSRLLVEALEDRVALAAAFLTVDAGTLPVAAGDSTAVTVTAKAGAGNTATDYRGTISLSSSDQTAVLTTPLTLLPAAYTFTAADNGVHTFPVTLHVAGSQKVKATDTAISSITGIGNVAVVAGPLATF